MRENCRNEVADKCQTHDNEDFFDRLEVAVYSEVPQNDCNWYDKPHPREACNQLKTTPDSNQVSRNQGDVCHNKDKRGRDSNPAAIMLAHDISKPLLSNPPDFGTCELHSQVERS